MGKHTPGPWEVTSLNGWNAVKPTSAILAICTLVENNPANADLIAAAPDLLEAVEMLLIGAAACAIPHPKEREVLQMAVDFAIKAKNKAKGGA